MQSWGLGDGRPPLTTDPENHFKPFAVYKDDDDDTQVSTTTKVSSKTT